MGTSRAYIFLVCALGLVIFSKMEDVGVTTNVNEIFDISTRNHVFQSSCYEVKTIYILRKDLAPNSGYDINTFIAGPVPFSVGVRLLEEADAQYDEKVTIHTDSNQEILVNVIIFILV
eukprot:Platyproteum_vivax@DN5565_c0_g1_i2.p1